MDFKVTFEPRGALYVQIRDARVTRTVELVKDELLVDLDEHANVLGIEALRPGTLSVILRQIPQTYHLPAEAQFIDFEKIDRELFMVSA